MQRVMHVVVTALLLLFVAGCTQPPQLVVTHITGPTMGTTYNIKYSGKDDLDPEVLQAEIDIRLVEINKLMSTYDPESELSRFNRHNDSSPFPMSEETLVVLNEALRLGELSQGYLDVTVGPLVNLWGFGPTKRPDKVPSAKAVESTRQQIGLDKLQINDGAVVKSHSNLYVDLSTIAKGYGVDSLASILEKHGISNYLVEIGGEMRVSGVNANSVPWRIAVEKPITNERAMQRLIAIGDNAIATSGDYRNYFEENGVRYSHLIDPTTGYPIKHNVVAVTVVHESSMTADGLATALNVMGKEAALAVAEKNNLAVLLITRENGEFKEYTSARFAQAIKVLK